MPKKQSKKKTSKTSSETIDSEISASETEVEEENNFEESEVNDSDIEDEDDDDYEEKDDDLDEDDDDVDNDNIDENESLASIKEEDKEDNCFFAYDKDNEMDLFDDDDEFDNDTQTDQYLTNDNRISINRMSLYEFVRLIGIRTKQLSMGAKPMIKNHQGLSSKEIAILELKNDTIPLIIKRPLPDNRFEVWKVKELSKDHLFTDQ